VTCSERQSAGDEKRTIADYEESLKPNSDDEAIARHMVVDGKTVAKALRRMIRSQPLRL
jgi:hypothetical protein